LPSLKLVAEVAYCLVGLPFGLGAAWMLLNDDVMVPDDLDLGEMGIMGVLAVLIGFLAAALWPAIVVFFAIASWTKAYIKSRNKERVR
jgi:hypothetical protein